MHSSGIPCPPRPVDPACPRSVARVDPAHRPRLPAWLALLALCCAAPGGLAQTFVTEETPPPGLTTPTPVEGELQVLIQGLDAEDQAVLRNNVELLLSIKDLEGEPIPSESRLRWLHQRAREEIRQALQPFGYYDPSIDAELAPVAGGWQARYRIEPGPPLPVASVAVELLGDGADDARFQAVAGELRDIQGDILVHSEYQSIKQRLQSLATERGYFDARFTRSEIQVDLAAYEAAAYLTLDTGPRYTFGPVIFGESALAPEFLHRFVDIEPGQPYLAGELLQLQSDLIGADYFERVEVDASPDEAVGTTLPVGVALTMRPQTRYVFGLGYGTDTGPRGRIGYERRWVNRWGHKFRSELEASLIRQGIGAGYTIPGSDPRTEEWGFNLSFTREELNDRESLTGLVGGEYRISRGRFRGTNYLRYLYEDFTIGEDEDQVGLLIPGVNWTWISTDDVLNVESGGRARLMLQGSYEFAISDLSFLQAQLGFKWIQTLGERHRLIGRTDAGTTLINDEDFPSFPSSLRFFTGGDRSVRGYRRDSIGPEDEEGNNIGGKHLVVGSIEYEYRFLDNWAVAAFADVGDAFDNETPELRTGVGLGVRWFSPIGPVRVDLASGLNEPGDPIRLHLTVGPEL